MVVRDVEPGLEVLMLRRNLKAAFAGGAYVFPGGAIDPSDSSSEVVELCRGRTDAEASTQLGVPNGGLAYFVAAVRECFEEAGILLAGAPDDGLVAFSHDVLAARMSEHRTALHAGTTDLASICRSEGLVLALEGVEYFSHWITPLGAPRRFDTRFFVAAAPPRQPAVHDASETVDSLWIGPAEALARHREGSLDLIFPTIRNLEALCRFETVEAVMSAARLAGTVPAMLPRISLNGEGVRILLPGDAGYAEASEEAGILEDMPLPGRPGGPSLD